MAHTQFDTRSSELPGEFQQWLLEIASNNDDSIERLKRNLANAIQSELTPRQREMLLMLYSKGYSQIEIAKELEVNRSTVSRTLDRAHKRLYRALRYAF